LVLPAKLRDETHQFVMRPISTGEVMMHIYIGQSFSSEIYLAVMALDHFCPISSNSPFISAEDFDKWEVAE